MDVVSDKKVTRLVASQGMTRVFEMEDNTWVIAKDGTVSWRNNNPGNLKFEFAGSADTTVHSLRSKEKALEQAQSRYDGVVDLDHWGNAVFESYEAGREAQRQLVVDKHADHTVDELVKGYSKADYSGATHHDAQARTIYSTALAEGHDLHSKKVRDMTPDEQNALLDGIARAEYWKAGTTNQTPPLSEDQLRTALGPGPQQNAHAPAHAVAHHRDVHRQGDHGAAVTRFRGISPRSDIQRVTGARSTSTNALAHTQEKPSRLFRPRTVCGPTVSRVRPPSARSMKRRRTTSRSPNYWMHVTPLTASMNRLLNAWLASTLSRVAKPASTLVTSQAP